MKLLDAVNLILPKLGEHPVTNLDTKHPTLAILLPIVENELRTKLLKGWWFNSYDNTLYPNIEGTIDVGQDTLSFVPHGDVNAAVRGTKLFNTDTASFVWTTPVTGCIRSYVEFDDLPEVIAQHVFSSALVNAYATDIGLTDVVKLWQATANDSYSDLLAEHLRHQKHSTRNSRRWRNLRNAMVK